MEVGGEWVPYSLGHCEVVGVEGRVHHLLVLPLLRLSQEGLVTQGLHLNHARVRQLALLLLETTLVSFARSISLSELGVHVVQLRRRSLTLMLLNTVFLGMEYVL